MTTKEKVLQLLKETQQILSGEKIAQQLSISRTAVWKAIKELEKSGYQFEHTASGYRYVATDLLAADEILSPALTAVGLRVKVANQSESTMKDAKLAIANNEAAPLLFIADTQTSAHGRFGRPFYAHPGQGIYMSLLLHPQKKFTEMPQYTVLAAVAVAEAIDELTGQTSQIKWVNDIYINGKKICGILSEASSDFESGTINYVTIGMGLNFSIPQTDFPIEIQQKASSLFPDGKPTITRNQLIQKIWTNFFGLLAKLPNEDYLTVYRQKSFVLGKTVTFTQKNVTYQGIATAITDTGELVVETPEQTFTLSSGEISLQSIGD